MRLMEGFEGWCSGGRLLATATFFVVEERMFFRPDDRLNATPTVGPSFILIGSSFAVGGGKVGGAFVAEDRGRSAMVEECFAGGFS